MCATIRESHTDTPAALTATKRSPGFQTTHNTDSKNGEQELQNDSRGPTDHGCTVKRNTLRRASTRGYVICTCVATHRLFHSIVPLSCHRCCSVRNGRFYCSLNGSSRDGRSTSAERPNPRPAPCSCYLYRSWCFRPLDGIQAAEALLKLQPASL